MTLLTLIIFCIGLFFGSFLLVIADRSGNNTSYILGRSKCDNCGHVLGWFELIPVLSFFLQHRRCRHCKKKLSLWFPIAEITTGLLFSLVFIVFMPLGISSVLFAEVIVSCLFIIFITDYKYEIIPFPVVAFGSVVALSGIYLSQPQALLNHVFSGLIAGLFFLIIFLITRGKGMGFGDVVYAVFMGLLLGFPYILAGLYITFIGGAIISLILVALKKKKLHGGTIAFGPFLVMGTFIMLIAGPVIMQQLSLYLGGII